jgi:phage-related baseplate assembly protein
MTYAPTAVDLSRLPPPALVEVLSYQQILSELKADLVARWPDYDLTALEGSPVTMLLEVFSYRETLLRARINDAARATMLAFARGPDLDHLGALFGIVRLVVRTLPDGTQEMEPDERFRRRLQYAPEAFSMGGPRGAYIFHGLTIDPSVHDCWAWQKAPGRVEVVLAALPGQEVPDAVIARLIDLFAFEDKTPLTDSVSVRRADVIPYSVAARLVIPRGPDPETIRQEAMSALLDYAASRDRIAQTVYSVGIDAALKVPGVETVIRSAPAGDVVTSGSQIARLQSATLDIEVR